MAVTSPMANHSYSHQAPHKLHRYLSALSGSEVMFHVPTTPAANISKFYMAFPGALRKLKRTSASMSIRKPVEDMVEVLGLSQDEYELVEKRFLYAEPLKPQP